MFDLHSVKIVSTKPGEATIELDGVPLKGVCSLNVNMGYEQVTLVQFTILSDNIEVSAEAAEVLRPDEE